MKWTLLLPALLCLQSASPAQTLQKCSGKDGVIAYRSGSCVAGEVLVAVRADAPETRDPGQRQASQDHPPDRQASMKRRSRSGRVRIAGNTHARAAAGRHRKTTKDPCASAKQARDRFRQRRGIEITMADLSRWNHRVYDACK